MVTGWWDRRDSESAREGNTKQKSHQWINDYLISTYLVCIDHSLSFKKAFWLYILLRTAVCSAPHVRQSTERRPALSPKARWKFTASPSRCRVTRTVAPSRSSTAYHLAYRYFCTLSYYVFYFAAIFSFPPRLQNQSIKVWFSDWQISPPEQKKRQDKKLFLASLWVILANCGAVWLSFRVCVVKIGVWVSLYWCGKLGLEHGRNRQKNAASPMLFVDLQALGWQ